MREKLSLDFAWRFHLDNMDYPVDRSGMMYYYDHTKAERGCGPAGQPFYDLDWEVVDLPHDYGVDQVPDKTYTNAFGFMRRPNAWYRRMFAVPKSDMGKRLILQFDGVATGCTVWINGHLVKRNFCGYTSFVIDITDFVDYGEMLNLLAVKVDTSEFEGWWYEGAGIYRHVWLIKTDDISVDSWGTFVNPRREADGWMVDVEVNVNSQRYEGADVCMINRIVDADGTAIAENAMDVNIPPRAVQVANDTLQVKNPNLWSVETPNLYTLQTIIVENGDIKDVYETPFGFRTLLFTADKGFFLNDQPVKLKGVCAHEDQANLGVALPDDVREQRMKMLKFMGCNAYRCSHNPPTPEMLELCDRLGILVMDENRWFDCSEQGLCDLEHMIRRDRNHPSIIMWSMANEEPLQGTLRGKSIMNAMRFKARTLDVSRPIMMAMHDGLLSEGVAGISDVIGINYNEEAFDAIHERYPNTPLVSSEIGGMLNEMRVMLDGSGYDWEAVNTRDFFMGMFKWAAFGYRGESRGWPRMYSRSGIIEANLQPKENTWFYKQMWSDENFVKIWPVHWNHEGKEDEIVSVKAYTNGDALELFLNGESLGKKSVNIYRRTAWEVSYQTGELKVVAFKDGQEIARETLCTSGMPAKVMLQADRDTIKANRTDAITFTAGVVDADGQPVLWSNNNIRFRVEGPATILAVSSSDPYDMTPAKAPERKLHGGTCQLILRTTTQTGEIRVIAESNGLASCVATIEATPCQRLPHVPQELDVDAMVYYQRMGAQN